MYKNIKEVLCEISQNYKFIVEYSILFRRVCNYPTYILYNYHIDIYLNMFPLSCNKDIRYLM